MYAMTEVVCAVLQQTSLFDGSRYPHQPLENIALGVDMFDCVLPSRNARNGMLYTFEGSINIKNKKWKMTFLSSIQMLILWIPNIQAYLRHLFSVNELLGKQIATIHNLGFYLALVRQAREKILSGEFTAWKDKMVKQMDKRL